MNIKFGSWDSEIHNSIDQIQRIAASRTSKIKKGIVELDLNYPLIKIKGSASEPYVATLEECTCVDYQMRGLPCKHMYALADALGLITDFPEYKGKNSSFDSDSEIERYYNLFLSGDLSADDLSKLYKVLSKI